MASFIIDQSEMEILFIVVSFNSNSGNSYAKFGSSEAQRATIERLMKKQTEASERSAAIASAPKASDTSPYATWLNTIPVRNNRLSKTTSPSTKPTETKFSGYSWNA